MQDLHIVDHPTKGTQAFHVLADAKHYAGSQPVRSWYWLHGAWVEGIRTVPLRGRRR